MKLKNVLCMAAVSAAVALIGVPVNGVPLTVQAEESQLSKLDDILRQIYGCYVNEDYGSMFKQDTIIAALRYEDLIRDSGSDRYVIDLDGNTKAMMYVNPDGGYWYYFGQMTNNLRQGNGTTIIVTSSNTEIFTGNYNADYPSGAGTLTRIDYEGDVYAISGDFQGTYLNGTYSVNANWIEYGGIACTGNSLSITYAHNHIQSVDGWTIESEPGYDGSTLYCFKDGYSDLGTHIYGDSEIFTVGLCDWSISCWEKSSGELNSGLRIFSGDSSSVAVPTVPATPDTTATTPVSASDTTVTTPASTPDVPNSYTVQRGDNLSKIAQKVYGDRKLWKKIYEANSNIIKSDYTIWVNQELVIPTL